MRTVFVVGAGASAEFGFPVGASLQNQIRNRVSPELLPNQTSRELEALAGELEARGVPYEEQNELFSWFGRTLPLANSIDSFLEDQSKPGDAVSFLGKYFIAKLIAEAEQASPLYLKPRHQPDFGELSKTWLGKFWAKLNRGGAAQVNEKSFHEIAFVTFNYDRCIEQFLFFACQAYYRMSAATAADFVRDIAICHVYGSLGDPFSDDEGLIFGEGGYPHHVLKPSERILTYSERVGTDQLHSIAQHLNQAHQIVFLGFSYAPINQRILDHAEMSGGMRKVFGTSYRMSSPDKERARDWCDNTFRRGEPGTHLQDALASEFFDQNTLLFGQR